jgi:hypothetical protein
LTSVFDGATNTSKARLVGAGVGRFFLLVIVPAVFELVLRAVLTVLLVFAVLIPAIFCILFAVLFVFHIPSPYTATRS